MNTQLIDTIDQSIRSNIVQIVKEIKVNQDYDAGARIILEKSLSFRDIFSSTLKLNIFDCARLADAVKRIQQANV